jgi:hypothetical protein
MRETMHTATPDTTSDDHDFFYRAAAIATAALVACSVLL